MIRKAEMKKSDHKDETPPLYEVEEVLVERRLNHPDRRALAARKAATAKRAKSKQQAEFERRRHPGRRATDPKPVARAKKR